MILPAYHGHKRQFGIEAGLKAEELELSKENAAHNQLMNWIDVGMEGLSML